MSKIDEEFRALLSSGDGKNEPPLPPLIAKSFVFVNTTGLRETPGLLILELFREVCYTEVLGKGQHHIDPEDGTDYSDAEKSILFLTRGRLKKKKTNEQRFYTPIYPSLARAGWLRKQSDRQLRDAMLRGFLAQSLRDSSTESASFLARKIVMALYGHRSVGVDANPLNIEILSAAIASTSIDLKKIGLRTCEEAMAELESSLFNARSGDKDGTYTFKMESGEDIFSKILTTDLIYICNLEERIPRLQWIEVLKCYLRTAISVWVLSKMKLTVWLRDQIVKTLEDPAYIISESDFLAFLKQRHLSLFNPSSTATDGPNVHVTEYMRARVELTILAFALKSVDGIDSLKNIELVASDTGSTHITTVNFLTKYASSRVKIKTLAGELSIKQWLLRVSEKFSAWTDPQHKGQGKNLVEFLRVLARSAEADGDFGYLVTPVKSPGRLTNYSVFPGAMLIKTIAYLAGEHKKINTEGASNRLVLSDIEKHFRHYGIEFGLTASARPKLIT